MNEGRGEKVKECLCLLHVEDGEEEERMRVFGVSDNSWLSVSLSSGLWCVCESVCV